MTDFNLGNSLKIKRDYDEKLKTDRSFNNKETPQ